MFFKPRKKPLLSCDIVHTLPGRIRIHCRALGFLDDYKDEIRDRLLSDFAVTAVTAAAGSESLLIHFEADKSNSREILELVEAVMAGCERYRRRAVVSCVV